MVITSNSEYHTAMAQIESFIERGFANLSQEETDQLAALSKAAEIFENQKFPMPLLINIQKILSSYMYEHNINQAQLSERLEIPPPALSAIMKGKKKINLDIAKKLHRNLKIDGNILLEVA